VSKRFNLKVFVNDLARDPSRVFDWEKPCFSGTQAVASGQSPELRKD